MSRYRRGGRKRIYSNGGGGGLEREWNKGVQSGSKRGERYLHGIRPTGLGAEEMLGGGGTYRSFETRLLRN